MAISVIDHCDIETTDYKPSIVIARDTRYVVTSHYVYVQRDRQAGRQRQTDRDRQR